MDSILNSIKQLLGVSEEYHQFDANIIMQINSVFLTLNQLGVGPDEVFEIQDEYTRWRDFADDIGIVNSVKTYMYHKVRMEFDPPTSSAVIDSTERKIAEYEWRLNAEAEYKNKYRSTLKQRG